MREIAQDLNPRNHEHPYLTDQSREEALTFLRESDLTPAFLNRYSVEGDEGKLFDGVIAQTLVVNLRIPFLCMDVPGFTPSLQAVRFVAHYLPDECLERIIDDTYPSVFRGYKEYLQGVRPISYTGEKTMIQSEQVLVAKILTVDEERIFLLMTEWLPDNPTYFDLCSFYYVLHMRSLMEEPVNVSDLIRHYMALELAHDPAFMLLSGKHVIGDNPGNAFFLLFSGLYRFEGVNYTPLDVARVLLSHDEVIELPMIDPRFGAIPEVFEQLRECLNQLEIQHEFNLDDLLAQTQGERRETEEQVDTLFPGEHHPELVENMLSFIAPERSVDVQNFIFPMRYSDQRVWRRRLVDEREREQIRSTPPFNYTSNLDWLRIAITHNMPLEDVTHDEPSCVIG